MLVENVGNKNFMSIFTIVGGGKIKYFSYLPTQRSNCWVGKEEKEYFDSGLNQVGCLVNLLLSLKNYY
jgi:hypothetical protein